MGFGTGPRLYIVKKSRGRAVGKRGNLRLRRYVGVFRAQLWHSLAARSTIAAK